MKYEYAVINRSHYRHRSMNARHLTSITPQGPVASLFAAQLLAWAGMCAIKRSASHCTHLRKDLELSDREVAWLAFLASKRDTFVLPAPNCQGYVRNTRSEGGRYM